MIWKHISNENYNIYEEAYKAVDLKELFREFFDLVCKTIKSIINVLLLIIFNIYSTYLQNVIHIWKVNYVNKEKRRY